MSTNICNRLDKVPPPSFVTIQVSKKSKRKVVLEWSKIKSTSKYLGSVEYFKNELKLLNGFIERKGTQLRLEKALLLTKQTSKIGRRWVLNDASSQLEVFEESIGIFDRKSGHLMENISSRLPTSQWSTWIIYLLLRDAVLLAKIKNQCEKTVKYWLGLISLSYHWGDSLVITAILSRLWHLSSIMLQDLIHILYPAVIEISKSLESIDSRESWPDEEFQIPPSLHDWLVNDMQIDFDQAIMRSNLDVIEKFIAQDSEYLVNTKLKNPFKIITSSSKETDPSLSSTNTKYKIFKGNESTKDSELSVGLNICSSSTKIDDEDLGLIISRKDINKTNLDPEKKRSRKDNEVLDKKSIVRKYWRKFFLKYPTHIESRAGRKKLLKRLDSYIVDQESNVKIAKKLKILRKSVRLYLNDCDKDLLIEQYTNFNNFISKKYSL